MPKLSTFARLAGAAVLAIVAQTGQAPAASHLAHFRSEAELVAYLKHLRRPPPPPPPPMAEALSASPPIASGAPSAQSVVVTAERSTGITNNQESGVDEGDIVKLHGDTLVILRRGRLFTVSLAGGGMRAIDSINAYPPGIDAGGDWYDEMLIAGDRIVVVGYSYSRGGTQINRFHVGRAGKLSFEDAYQLRSNDYYSSRNYASRLIGHQLVLYSPRYLSYYDPLAALPALRRWNGTGKAPGFERIGTAREVYLPPQMPDESIAAVHTISRCDLTAPVLDCKATSVLGPDGRVFYVSAQAVYVWVTPWFARRPGNRPSAFVYRMPFDGSAPSAVAVRGAPVDQFSFREDPEDGVLNVLVRANSAGDAMWSAERSEGAVALLRLPLSAFGDGTRAAALDRYRALPTPKEGADFHNRFAGPYLLYGEGNGWGRPRSATTALYAVPVAGGDLTMLDLPHPVDRIELMGPDAVVVGSDEHNLYFSSVLLGRRPVLGGPYMLPGAAQGETRSHGFFFSPDPGSRDGSEGVLGLPITMPAKPAYRQLFDTSAAMLFLRRAAGAFMPLGQLDAHDESAADDRCIASCVDWYGNARPIFVGRRSFALMGYELVEGALDENTIRETGRIVFAPTATGTR